MGRNASLTASRRVAITSCVVLLCAGWAAVWSSSAAAETLTVATFNAEFLIPSKVHVKYGLKFRMGDNTAAEQNQWSAPGFREARFDQATAVVGEFLATLETDVLTLTEVGDADSVSALVDVIAANGTDYDHVIVCSCNDPTGQRVAILSKVPFTEEQRKIPGREAYELEVDDPDEEKDTGLSKAMRVTVAVDGEPIDIYVAHLKSERGGHEADAQRIAQASILRRTTVPALTANRHVILTGDMNDRRGQPTIRRLRGLDDIWPDLIQTGHFKFFDREEEASRWTYRFRGELNQIDHVLVSYSLRKNSNSISSRVIDVPADTTPPISDHRPLVVTMELP